MHTYLNIYVLYKFSCLQFLKYFSNFISRGNADFEHSTREKPLHPLREQLAKAEKHLALPSGVLEKKITE